MYSILKNILFLFDAEKMHVFSLRALSFLNKTGLLCLIFKKRVIAPVTVMGIEFPNAVGLAAGLDKDAQHIAALEQCGFGFIEVGTVTPVAQPGNDKPRLFRLVSDQAIINRMGFNNHGVDALVAQVKKVSKSCVLGINIGKNKDTSLENAVNDYLLCMDKVYQYADYITINISSPNTLGLRELQHGEGLSALLLALKEKQKELSNNYDNYVPLAVKIAPDLNDEEIKDIASRLLSAEIDAVIATNTTNSRPSSLLDKRVADETGGLSGTPVFEMSTMVLKNLVSLLDGRIPVIAAGGISTPRDAVEKIKAGASLVQIYTGFIYKGPSLINACATALRDK